MHNYIDNIYLGQWKCFFSRSSFISKKYDYLSRNYKYGYNGARMGPNFDDYPDFQPKIAYSN